MIKVTTEDLETGEKQSITIENDYVIVTSGECYIAHTQVSGNGTHQLTIKGRKNAAIIKDERQEAP